MKDLENLEKEILTISVVKANLYGLLFMLPVAFIFGYPFYLLHGRLSISEWGTSNIIMFLTAVVVGVIVHELLHGITWARFSSKGFESIKFGVMWKMLTPYCHCKEPLTVRSYLWGAVVPAIALGFLPALAAIIIGSTGLLYFGTFFTIAAIGDFMIIYLLRNENKDDWVQDHPSKAGCIIYRETTVD
ncbi:putative zincin peptidase [Fodinibius salinus]|uniref:Putative zincin peptidase n=1 Tax=Fodinibius salinus TaxID=860790 RepID=A0A5D3YL87_9BACT|nr:DUF3267 domain-containing protein [Fodinibius salinus]TYP93427.1 putative zincin peptidase [Fodinibius salinus]